MQVRTDLDLDQLRRKGAWATALAASTGWNLDHDRIILESLSVTTLQFLDQEQ